MKHLKRIGLYGVSSTGKTTIAKHIEALFLRFKCIDGSAVIDKICPGGISEFKKLDKISKNKYREKGVAYIRDYQSKIHKNIIVTGHYSFLLSDGTIEKVWTEADNDFYTDIIHIKDEPANIYSRCILRKKTCISLKLVRKWVEYEENAINSLIKQDVYNVDSNNIEEILDKTKEIINQLMLKKIMSDILKENQSKLTILLDADGTLIPYDSAEVMSKYLNKIKTSDIKDIFKKYNNYCFSAFYDVAVYFSKNNSSDDFIKASKQSVLEIEIRNEFIDLINKIDADFIIVTAGFSILWKELVKKYNLNNVKVIGGNTLYDDCIIGQKEKGYIVELLKYSGKIVACFGDALIDKDMFIKSDIGYLIINERKKSIIPYIQNNTNYQYISYKGVGLQGMQQTNFFDIKKKLDELNND